MCFCLDADGSVGSGFVRDVVAFLEPFFRRHEEEVPEATNHLEVLAEAAQAADANAPIESEFWHSVEVALCIALREGNPRLMYASNLLIVGMNEVLTFCLAAALLFCCFRCGSHAPPTLIFGCCYLFLLPIARYVRTRRDSDGQPVSDADFSVITRLIAALDWAWVRVCTLFVPSFVCT